jgi:hypothetical protein
MKQEIETGNEGQANFYIHRNTIQSNYCIIGVRQNCINTRTEGKFFTRIINQSQRAKQLYQKAEASVI